MPSIPLKREYAPTLGELLWPRWRAAGRGVRALVVVGVVAFCALVGAVVLTVIDSGYSHGGPVPFSFRYRSLSHRTPVGDEYVRLEADGAHGKLENLFAVAPLQLPAYAGRPSGYLPVYATAVVAALARQYPDFALIGEGEERVNTVSGQNNPAGYEIMFTTRRAGQVIDGRAVLVLDRHSAGERSGVIITMLTHANSAVDKSHPVGNQGVLNLPFGTFAFTA
jgi:hypothetical protein